MSMSKEGNAFKSDYDANCRTNMCQTLEVSFSVQSPCFDEFSLGQNSNNFILVQT